MRLLDTRTLKLCEFVGIHVPKYAILSHTWGDEEVSFQDLGKPESCDFQGFKKIRSCCTLARSDGWDYLWVDTCCIDKTSSAELSEAINSMYQWYEQAQVCYAYLIDISVVCGDRKFIDSRWFTRGWTLQELLAPASLVFYDSNWHAIGTRSSLLDTICRATGISQDHIKDHRSASAAAKMSWASKRQTFRLEDMAYSLLGLFGIDMPLVYGEGINAFARLQTRILKASGDESLFAWKNESLAASGILARFPADFADSGDITTTSDRLPMNPFRPRLQSISQHRIIMDVLALKAEENKVNPISTKLLNLLGEDLYCWAVPLNCARSTDGFPIKLLLTCTECPKSSRTTLRLNCHRIEPFTNPLDFALQAKHFNIEAKHKISISTRQLTGTPLAKL